MLTQDQAFGCGMYAVANALNLPSFVTPERLEASKTGNRKGQLDRWMQEDGMDWYIEALYYDHVGKKLPETALSYKPVGEDIIVLPILLNVRFTEGGLNHLVGARIDTDGVGILFDSLKKEPLTMTLREMNEHYPICYGLFIFSHISGDYVFIKK